MGAVQGALARVYPSPLSTSSSSSEARRGSTQLDPPAPEQSSITITIGQGHPLDIWNEAFPVFFDGRTWKSIMNCWWVKTRRTPGILNMPKRDAILYDICSVAAAQHPVIRDTLVNTGKKEILFCYSDLKYDPRFLMGGDSRVWMRLRAALVSRPSMLPPSMDEASSSSPSSSSTSSVVRDGVVVDDRRLAVGEEDGVAIDIGHGDGLAADVATSS